MEKQNYTILLDDFYVNEVNYDDKPWLLYELVGDWEKFRSTLNQYEDVFKKNKGQFRIQIKKNKSGKGVHGSLNTFVKEARPEVSYQDHLQGREAVSTTKTNASDGDDLPF